MARVFYEERESLEGESYIDRSYLLDDDELVVYTRNVIRETLRVVAKKGKVLAVNDVASGYSAKRHTVPDGVFGETTFTLDKEHLLGLEKKILNELLYE